MRMIATKNIREGQYLASSLYNDMGSLLLAKGSRLNNNLKKKIENCGYSNVYIVDEYTKEEIEFTIRPELEQEMLKKAVEIRSKYPNISKLKEVVDDVVEEILQSNHTLLNLINVSIYDDYTYKHSLNTMILAVLTGKEYGLSKHRLKALGLGALIHDLGKTLIPESILNKPGRLSEKEYEQIKRHPKEGYYLANENDDISPTSKICILQHHERWDGSGYPYGLKGEDMHLYSRIVSVADVYEALVANRPYREGVRPQEAWELIAGGGGTDFDPTIAKIFVESVNPYPPNTLVKLSNGLEGVVLSHEFNLFNFPKIEVYTSKKTSVIVDLLKERTVVIDKVIDRFTFED